MKKIISALALLIVCIFCHSQNNSVLGTYYWKDAVVVYKYNLDAEAISNSKEVVDIGQAFQIIDVKNDDAIIRILSYRSSSEEYKKFNKQDSAQLYFTATLDQIEQSAQKYNVVPTSLTIGVINFPFKYRFQPDYSDFSGAFNFGAAVGYKIRHSSFRKMNYSFITGYSISSLTLDSVSVSQNSDDLIKSNNFTAFSFSVGTLFEYEKAQIGLFFGWDFLNDINHRRYGWKYQGRPWFSIGIGYSIFSNEKESTKSLDQPSRFKPKYLFSK